MKLPARYTDLRDRLDVDEVSCGCGGIKLLAAHEVDEGQIGYAIDPDGTSLCSGEDGSWRPNWTVVGNETACGDPLFVDTDNPALPVFTAIHGEGVWNPQPVAASIEAFGSSLAEFARIATGRSNPVELEHNPLPDVERESFLHRVAEVNGRHFDPAFWALLLEG